MAPLGDMLEVLDVIFHIIHISLLVIVVTFWMYPRTLRLSQIVLLITLVSWFGFGYFYGYGYCFITDWHWQIKEKLGESNLPSSYIKYVLDRLTGNNWDPVLVDRVAFGGLFFSIAGCLIQTFRLKKSKALS